MNQHGGQPYLTPPALSKNGDDGTRAAGGRLASMARPSGRGSTLLFAALVGAAGMAVGLPLAAGEDEGLSERAAAREILVRLDRRLQTIATMRGRFVQTFTSSGLGLPQSEGGRFFLSRPDLMRWDYTTPEKKTAVSDGTHTWLHIPEDGVVYRGTVAAWKRGGAFSILAGGSLVDAYDAAGVEAGTAARRGYVVLTLHPKTEREEFTSLLVELEPKGLRLSSVIAVDGAGNRIAALFSDVEENVQLDRGLFSFAPPAGARVIDQEPPAARP